MSDYDIATSAVLAIYYFAIGFLCIFGTNCILMLFLHLRHRKRMLAGDELVWQQWHRPDAELPFVTVQLPLYNEQYVAGRLVQAVCGFDYPKDRFEIQVLDDSTDITTEIVRELVVQNRERGFEIELFHRSSRDGFKAGALRDGNSTARGEFIAIFDADFVPPPDFLRRTIPFMDDPDIACVQTRLGYVNRSFSLLTIAQSVASDAFGYVMFAARNWSGLTSQFQGTGGVWRRAAIDDAGGWQTDTLTEDLDLSLRAQCRGWKIKLLPEIVCPAELPVTVSALMSQQRRWVRGSLENLFKLTPSILKSDLSLGAKCDSLYHMVMHLLHVCILFLVLAWPLQVWFRKDNVLYSDLELGSVVLLFSFCGPLAYFLYAQKSLYSKLWRSLFNVALMMIYSLGLAVNNTRAVLEFVLGVRTGFVRTPKYGVERASDDMAGKAYRIKFAGQLTVEILVCAYCLAGLVTMMLRPHTLVDPFLLFSTISLFIVIGHRVSEVLPGHALVSSGKDRQPPESPYLS